MHVTLKPTSSIQVPGRTIDVAGNPVEVVTTGRHDPCVGLRATPICEAMLAIVLMDHCLRHRGQNADVRSATPVITARKVVSRGGCRSRRPAAGPGAAVVTRTGEPVAERSAPRPAVTARGGARRAGKIRGARVAHRQGLAAAVPEGLTGGRGC